LRLSPDYTLFQRLKVGTGRVDGYRLTTCSEIERLRCLDLILYENERYGNTYVVDRPELDALLSCGRIPILHMGQLAGVRAVQRYPATWLSVLLWCSRDSAAKRLHERGASDTADAAARLAAWDETLMDLSHSHFDFGLGIDTDRVKPHMAADMVHARLTGT
jgi:guanylate kinase